jgi:ATP-dependent Zn protease
LLTVNLRVLHRMAEVLLEKESIDGADIEEIVKQYGASSNGESTEPVAAAAS